MPKTIRFKWCKSLSLFCNQANRLKVERLIVSIVFKRRINSKSQYCVLVNEVIKNNVIQPVFFSIRKIDINTRTHKYIHSYIIRYPCLFKTRRILGRELTCVWFSKYLWRRVYLNMASGFILQTLFYYIRFLCQRMVFESYVDK